ncbi:hypothetical protein B0H11DRAFT_1922383 [Mycena galericulata]|nr:hypothetical protein B0H11DRAFT_1922383 [Mycena galericulata]
MEKLPYIDEPLPMISMRQEWQLFSWRTLPPITARMSQEELEQLIGDIPPAKSASQTASVPEDVPHDNLSAASDLHASGRTEEAPGSSARSPPLGKHRLKPPGQPNRPGSGGYNLEKHLLEQCGWTQEDFQEVQKRVHALATERLDVSKCYRDQRGATVTAICEAVKKDHAIARGFEHCWVIKDMLIIHLKNTSEASRRRKVKRRTEAKKKFRGRYIGKRSQAHENLDENDFNVVLEGYMSSLSQLKIEIRWNNKLGAPPSDHQDELYLRPSLAGFQVLHGPNHAELWELLAASSLDIRGPVSLEVVDFTNLSLTESASFSVTGGVRSVSCKPLPPPVPQAWTSVDPFLSSYLDFNKFRSAELDLLSCS